MSGNDRPEPGSSRGLAGSDERPLVCCIVLTWNNFADTDECLRSLLAVDYRPLQIIVVDNASTDDSIERLKLRYQDSATITFVESGSNASIPHGYNYGFRVALQMGAAFVCQVDNDVVVEPTFFEELIRAFDAAPDVALAAPVILEYRRPGRVWYAGASYWKLLGLTVNHHTGKRFAELDLAGKTFSTDLVPTCAVMISREALERVGLLDERLAFSHDDVDWCLRAAASGLRCVVVGQPLARHKIAVTRGVKGTNLLGPRSAHDMAMGSYLVAAKHLRGPQWLPFLFGRLVMSLPYQCGRMALAGAWTSLVAYCRGSVDGLLRAFVPRGDDSAALKTPALPSIEGE